MTNEELNTKLYDKMYEEQRRYTSWLESLPTAEALTHASEYIIREGLLGAVGNTPLTEEQVRVLLASTSPLDEIFKSFEQCAADQTESYSIGIESYADDLISAQKEKDRVPLYLYPADYAREHDELDAYRTSLQANVSCKEAIEAAIAESYHDNRLDTSCVKPIMERFSAERVEYVLAATVQVKDWDERFSQSNKAWAATIPVVHDGNDIMGDRRTRLAVNKHSGLTDLFITAFRQEQQKQREAPPRMSIYDQLRQPLPQTAAPTPKKNKTQER